jgi:regulator of nucleoside diphosphate kinase
MTAPLRAANMMRTTDMTQNAAAADGAAPVVHMLAAQGDAIFNLALSVETSNPLVSELLMREVSRAQLHDAQSMPQGVATIGSYVDFIDDGSRRLRSVQLVMPIDADFDNGKLSILTPMGAGLIGLAAGQSIAWPDIEGHVRTLRILAVKQPG